MKITQKALNIKVILSFFCLFLGSTTYTEVPFTWMKDIYAVTTPEYNYLSPINGMVWSEQNIVENMYRYGNPDDATIKLIKELFYLQADNVSFRPTILKSKPASYWTPQTISTIMRLIPAYREDTTEASKKDAQLTVALEQIMQPQREAMQKAKEDLTTQLNTRGVTIKNMIKDIAIQNKALDSLIRQAKRVSPTTSEQERATKLEELEAKRKNLTDTRTPLEEELNKMTYESKAIDRALQTGITELIGYFVQSIKESESTEDTTQTYVSYTTEQILLALLWKIANPRKGDIPKQDFVDYFNEISAMVDSNNLKAWIIAKPYSKQDYEQFKKQFKTVERNELGNFIHFEQIILAVKGYGVWESPIPQIITGAQVNYIHPGGKQTTQFSDCVETSFRNYFNIVLYDGITSTFDIQRLIDAAQQDTEAIPLQLSKNLIDFYQKNPSATNLQASELYNAWTQVVEDLSGVIYVEPAILPQQDRFFNIKSSLPNMLKICNHLLFGNNIAFDQLSKKEQLNLICKKLSRDDFLLTWEIIEPNVENDKLAQIDYATLKFSINETISFEWQLQNGHSVIPPLENIQYPNAEVIIEELISIFNEWGPLENTLYALMAMFSPNETNSNIHSIFLQSLDTPNKRMDVINKLSESAIHDIALQAVLKQLMKSLIHGEFDQESASKAADLILENLKDETSPLHEVAQETFKNMKNQMVNAFLIRRVIGDKASNLYDAAKKKFEAITDSYALYLVIEILIQNAEGADSEILWHDIAEQKFKVMTGDYTVSQVISASMPQPNFVNEWLNDAWRDIIKQKILTMTEDHALSQVILLILDGQLDIPLEIVKQKFEAMTDTYPLSQVISAVINNNLEEWYDIAKQKFETMTEDYTGLGSVIPVIINNNLEAWYDMAKEKFETMTKEYAIGPVITTVIDAKLEAWYDLAKQKFETMTDNFELSYIIRAVIKPQLSSSPDISWTDVAKQKFETMTEDEEPRIIWIDDIETEEYPFASVINTIISKTKNYMDRDLLLGIRSKYPFAQFKAWDDLARKKFEAMENKKALSIIIEHVIESKCRPWYDIALEKAKAIGNDKLVYALKIRGAH